METAQDRLKLILGDERLKLLEGSTVMVLGLGGVGSSCAEALARGRHDHPVAAELFPTGCAGAGSALRGSLVQFDRRERVFQICIRHFLSAP